jgi:Abnormal spindle-like microcephaly-assoc'd, ASPM-SPD-2-Hydin
MGTNAGRQGSDGTGHRMVALGPVGGWRLTVPWRALIRGLLLCLVLAGWLAPGYGGLSVAAAGTTRYVALTGSDSGDCGGSATPCQTIGYALGQAQAGDTISIGAGTYAEHLDIEKNLSLVGAGASTTAIDGSTSGRVVTIGISNTAAVVTLSGVTVQHGNTASSGGGIVNAGSLTLTNSTVVSNTSTGYGNGGGGIYNTGTLTLTNSTVVSNTATSDGRGGGIYNTGTLTLTTSTVLGNSAFYFGGGIDNSSGTLTLTNSTVRGNTAGSGGGISNTGTLTLTNSTVSGNSTSGGNGAGGGIENWGTVTLTNSTVSGNSAFYGCGGGIGNFGTMTLTNTTVAGNRANSIRSGYGCSGGDGGGIYNTGTLTLTTSILAGNTTPNRPDRPDCSGTLTSGGYNLVGVGDGCGLTNGVNGDQVGTSSSPLNPLLGPLQDNGGPTSTMALLPGSWAIDVVPPSKCTLSTDQRGQPRPDPDDHGACNIGAVEADYPAQLPVVTGVSPNTGPYMDGPTVVIDGGNLVGPDMTATVRFGGVLARSSIADPSGTVITATGPATSGPSIVDVTVQTSVGTSLLTPDERFTYTSAGTLYVSTSGNDLNGCLTPASPCRTLGHAIAVAASGATISVAAGTYPETVTVPLSLTLVGAGASRTIVDGQQSGTAVTVNAGATVAISGVTIQNGSGSYGGGISNSGTVTLASSTIVSNTTTTSYGSGGGGGGIYNTGTLTLTNTTVVSNTIGGYAYFYGGGGIYNTGTLTLTNSTVSGNSARNSAGGYGSGGGISNGGRMTLTNSTVSGNSFGGSGYGYGGGIANSGTLTLTNTILAGNPAPSTPDCSGTLTSGGYNLVGDGDGCGLTNGVNGDQVGTGSSPLDPRLDPLWDYGGLTWTMAPQPGSPALDAVPASHCPLTTDQRGRARPDEVADGGACDIGAVEGAEPAPTISLSASSLGFGTESVDYFSVTQTVTLTNSAVAPVTISSTGITITGTNPEDFLETDTCAGTTIAPGTSCTIDVNFWPGDAGTRSAVLRITDNAADSPQRVALSGIGQFAVAGVSPLALDFGNQVVGTTSAVKSVTIQNNSQADLAIFEADLGTTVAFTATTSDCFVDAIAPGDSCTFDVRFRPQATGSSTGLLFIHDNAADSPRVVWLSGTGTLPATNTPVPPGATPRNAPVPPTSAPTTQPMSWCASHPCVMLVVCHGALVIPAPPPLSVGIAPHRTLVAGNSRALALSTTLGYVTGGGTLPLLIRTAPHATVNASLDVVATQVVIHGQGAHRTRTTRRVVLSHTTLHGTADATGRYSPQMHVAYQPTSPVVATLTVRAQANCDTATKRTTLTILPLRITVTPRRLVGGSPLTVTLHTGAKGQVSISLEVDTTRDTVLGQGTQRRHVRQVVALYRLRVTGTADAHGRFSRRVAIAYQPRTPLLASIGVTVRLPQGTATGRVTATLLPRHH